MDNNFESSLIKIFINNEDKPVTVMVKDYVKAKTKDLIEFGYSNLTEKEVMESVKRILNKEPLKGVIDHFIKDDIIIEE